MERKSCKERLNLLRQAGVKPKEALKQVIRQDYGTMNDLATLLGYNDANMMYTVFDPKFEQYNYKLVQLVSKELKVKKDWLKWYLGIEDKIIQREKFDNLARPEE